MPAVPILGGIVGETKRAPYTMLALVGLLITVPYIWTTFARASDLKALATQVSAVQYTVSKTALESQLRSINAELFDLRRKVSEMTAARASVDRIYYDRISTLENDKGSVERTLASLKP